MGRRGFRPTPTALRILRGNPGKRPLNAEEPKPPIDPSIVECPVWLRGDAKRFWQRFAPRLLALGLLTVLDGAAFEALAQSYHRWRQYERLCSKVGVIAAHKRGYRRASKDERLVMRQFAASFGMDPSSRSGIKAKAPLATGEHVKERFFGSTRP